MRTILLIGLLFFVTAIKAQTMMPSGLFGYTPINMFGNSMYYGDSVAKKKWSLNTYKGISSSVLFYNGGTASMISAPIGLQVTRMLNNNLYAFANVSVAPSYLNFNRSFVSPEFTKTGQNSLFSNGVNVYSSASMGLMYINSDKTFSISGSVSVGRSGYGMLPGYPVYSSRPVPYNPANR